MADRDAILAHLAETLDAARWRDYSPIGLQVEGRADVRKVATGVSANLAFFERARAAKADLLLVHHGLFWKNEKPILAGPLKDRLKFLLQHDLTLAGYHLPLDAHPELGNNALALREMGLVDLAPFGTEDGQTIGWRGRFAAALPSAELRQRLAAYYGQTPIAFEHGPANVSTLALVSGGGASFFRQAIEARVDAFVTGEPAEWAQGFAHEARAHFFAVGHHASERVGIRALGEHVAKRFGVAHEFLDVPNPV